MFCSNCGKNLADDAKFCDGCGQQMGGAPAGAATREAAPVASAPNPIFTDFLKVIKGFFSKNTVKTVGESAKSRGLEWLLIAPLSILTYIFALCINVRQIMDSIFSVAGAYGSMITDQIYNFGIWFLYGLLISVGVYFLMSAMIFVAVKFLFKKNISIMSVFNLVATASLPLACAWVLNIVLGFIWVPLIWIVSVVGIVATVVLLYAGMQKLDKLEKSPFLAYTGVWAVVVTVIVVIVCIAVNVAVDNAIGDAMGSLGSLSSLGNYLF